jgi:hypothetical protein
MRSMRRYDLEVDNRRAMSAVDTFADHRSIELMGPDVPIPDISCARRAMTKRKCQLLI